MEATDLDRWADDGGNHHPAASAPKPPCPDCKATGWRSVCRLTPNNGLVELKIICYRCCGEGVTG